MDALMPGWRGTLQSMRQYYHVDSGAESRPTPHCPPLVEAKRLAEEANPPSKAYVVSRRTMATQLDIRSPSGVPIGNPPHPISTQLASIQLQFPSEESAALLSEIAMDLHEHYQLVAKLKRASERER